MFKYLPLVMLLGCGKEVNDHIINPYKKPEVKREPALEPYMLSFEQVIGVSTKNIYTSFAEIDPAYAGFCYSWDTGERKIEVSISFWEKASEFEKENLIFHEAGHCALNLGHNEMLINKEKFAIPKSIMWPSVFGNLSYYRDFQNYYYEELKSHVN